MANPKHQRTTFQELCGLLVAPDAPPNHPMRQLGEELDKLTALQSGGSSTTVNNSISNTTVTGSGGTATAPDEELSPVLTGANVKGGTVLYFSGGACGEACSNNVDRAADAVCVRIVQASGLRAVYKHSGPMVVSLASGQTTLSRGNKLYLSASEPGTLTADDSEAAALFHQFCGRFIAYATDASGTPSYRLARASINIGDVASMPTP
jgi:hypothetical protein